jgi:hypothetical protein
MKVQVNICVTMSKSCCGCMVDLDRVNLLLFLLVKIVCTHNEYILSDCFEFLGVWVAASVAAAAATVDAVDTTASVASVEAPAAAVFFFFLLLLP